MALYSIQIAKYLEIYVNALITFFIILLHNFRKHLVKIISLND